MTLQAKINEPGLDNIDNHRLSSVCQDVENPWIHFSTDTVLQKLVDKQAMITLVKQTLVKIALDGAK